MLRVKLQTIDNNTFYIDNVTNYDNAIKVAERLYFPIFTKSKLVRICHIDEYEEELEVISGDELDNYLKHFYQINPDSTDDCYFENSNIKIKHSIIS